MLKLDAKLTIKISYRLHCQKNVYKEPFIPVCKRRLNNNFDVHFARLGMDFDTHIDHTI